MDKCKFHIQKTKFLDLIISIKDIEINPQNESIILDQVHTLTMTSIINDWIKTKLDYYSPKKI